MYHFNNYFHVILLLNLLLNINEYNLICSLNTFSRLNCLYTYQICTVTFCIENKKSENKLI